MNTDRLRFDLADLAGEVTPVDLRDRVLRTSRRLGIQRAVVTSTAALVMLGAATGTAFALMPDPHRPAPTPADSPSITFSPTPVDPNPTPEPSTSTAPTTSTTQTPTATIGRLVYGPAPALSDAATARVRSWRPGHSPVGLLRLPRDAALLNAAVSPDGRHVAWVDDGSTLWVSASDGSHQRKIRSEVDGQCWTPAWSPDSQRLTIATVTPAEPGAYHMGMLDVSTGKFTEIGPIEGCHPVWAAAGEVIAYADGTHGRVILTDPTGNGRESIPDLGGTAEYDSFDLASLSPDGSKVALYRRGPAMEAGDVARELDVNAVLDTRTGEVIDLPLGGRKLLQAYFQDDGTLVARVSAGDHNVVVLIGENGQKISETDEPTELKDMQILAATN